MNGQTPHVHSKNLVLTKVIEQEVLLVKDI